MSQFPFPPPILLSAALALTCGLQLHILSWSVTATSVIACLKVLIGHAFTVCIHTENQNQVDFFYVRFLFSLSQP